MKNHHSFASTLGRWALGVVLAATMVWFGSAPAAAQTGLGLALSFDGVDDYVSVTPGPALDWTNGTIEFWMNPQSLAGNACLLASGGPNSTQTRYRLDLSTNALGLWNGSSSQTVPFAVATGRWCHVAVVFSPTNAQFFVNGLPLGATTNDINLSAVGTPFTIGAAYNDSGNLSNYFAGILDEVRIWNVTRSPADITNHMFQPVSAAEPGLVACYRFDEAAGVRAYDATTNHLNGTLINRPVRVASYWWPVITLNSANPLTNECHVAFADPTTVNASPVALAGGPSHSLALKADGTVVVWGYNNSSQTNIPASAVNVTALAAGYGHSLALKWDGMVVGWGANEYGQTNIPAGATNVVAVAAGFYHSLALKGDGMVVGWGDNYYGQTTIPASATNVEAVAASWSHSLALRGDGMVVGWGRNIEGQTTIPASATNVVAIAAGEYHNLALKGDGTVVGWGAGGPGTSGYPNSGQTTIPADATNVVSIGAGYYHSLALKRDGTVAGWGRNLEGQTTIPPSATNVVAIAAGAFHSVALRGDGTIVGWGDYSSQPNILKSVYQLNLALSVDGTVDTNAPGVYTLTYSATNALGAVGSAARAVVVADTRLPVLTLLGANPLLHALGAPFTDPGATATDLCAGDLTGSIVITNTVNSSLPGSYTNTYTVADASGNTTQITRSILVGGPLATTLPASGLLNDAATLKGIVNPNGVDTTAWFEWGGVSGSANTTPLVAVGSGTAPVPLSAGFAGLTPGLTYHYQVVASNSVGVTRGAARTFWSPAIVLNGANPLTNECHVAFVDPGAKVSASPTALAGGASHSLALKADGTVVGWGNNGSGQTTIPARATNVVVLAAGYSHNLALKGDGTVVGWGNNVSGQTRIPAGATNVVALAAGYSHSLALKADGTVVGWGSNNYGQTNIPASVTNVEVLAAGWVHNLALKGDRIVVGWGRNDYGQTNIPAGATNVVALAAGYYHSLALRGDGTVVGWGRNDYGQTNIPARATNVVALAAGGYHSLALRGDGTVVGWGANSYGQATIPASATNVVAIAAGYYHSLALKGNGTVVGWGENVSGQTTIPASVYQLNLDLSANGTVDTNPPGVYILTYSATNALGAVGAATRTVVVADTRPPVLALLGDNSLLHALGASFTDPGATATDLCAGDLTGSIVVTNTVNSSLPGSYTNTYTVADASGNTTRTNRVVTVLPLQPVFAGNSVLASGQFRLQAAGTAGLTYTLQTSTNLVNWVNHTNLVASPGGLIDCLMDTGTNAPACFYRLSWP